jgi:hypothetical protein
VKVEALSGREPAAEILSEAKDLDLEALSGREPAAEVLSEAKDLDLEALSGRKTPRKSQKLEGSPLSSYSGIFYL